MVISVDSLRAKYMELLKKTVCGMRVFALLAVLRCFVTFFHCTGLKIRPIGDVLVKLKE